MRSLIGYEQTPTANTGTCVSKSHWSLTLHQAHYWTTIPKNRTSYHPSRGVKEEEITKIIQAHLVVEPDIAVAEAKLLATDGLRRFYNSLKTAKEKDDFQRHLRRYMQIYLPDTPFEVSSTNRYTITTQEACIVARQYIKRNQTIKYLSGIQVVITPEEEEALSSRKKDFSIVVSSRNKCTSLFMGPARFANHDCGANAKLMTTGQAGIEIVAVRNIDVGEEITVTYGENYFGEDNCECLCQTCEDNQANGWKQPEGTIPVKESIEGGLKALEGYSLRRRRREERGDSSSRTPSVTPDIRPRVARTRVRKLLDGRASTTDSGAVDTPPVSLLNCKRDADVFATPPVTPAKRHKPAHFELIPGVSAFPTEESRSSSDDGSGDATSRSDSLGGEAVDTDVTTPENISETGDGSPKQTPISQAIEALKQEHDIDELPAGGLGGVALYPGTDATSAEPIPLVETPQQKNRGFAIHDLLNTPSAPSTPQVKDPSDPFASAFQIQGVLEHHVQRIGVQAADHTTLAESQISIMTTTEVKTESEPLVTSLAPEVPMKRRPGRPKKVPRPPPPPRKAAVPKDTEERDESPAPSHRTPGDYTLTPALLSEPDMAWVVCRNCTNAFVQQNAYYTRASCPRCERHSMLYGYVWPKTQPEGKNDKEERILDHRTVHRFLATDEELLVRGRALPRTETPGGKRNPVGRPPKSRKRQSVDDDDEDDVDYNPDPDIRRSGRMRKASFKIARGD